MDKYSFTIYGLYHEKFLNIVSKLKDEYRILGCKKANLNVEVKNFESGKLIEKKTLHICPKFDKKVTVFDFDVKSWMDFVGFTEIVESDKNSLFIFDVTFEIFVYEGFFGNSDDNTHAIQTIHQTICTEN